MKLSKNARNAIFIGSLCSVSYLAVYFARNILSAVTPQMLATGKYTKPYISQFAFLYLLCYGVGQLINGTIGDKIKARYMISFGLLLAGITNLIFSYITDLPIPAQIVYGLTGFFLAMIYGPMTKVVAENTEPIHATRCSLGYTAASFFGSPLAGVVAAICAWQNVFMISSIFLFVMSAIVFICFFILEKKGIVKYGQYKRVKSEKNGLADGVKVLVKHRIVKFALISILTGVVRTSVVFWLPTYIAEYHGYADDIASTIFSIATFVISFAAFIVVFVYERIMKRDMDKTILLMFSLSAVFFLLVYFVKSPIANIAFMVLAIMASNSAATMLWSRYCPSLRDTGMVSSATGFLDFLSYMAAAVSNLLFASAADDIGWGNLILVWFALMILGVLVALPYGKIFRKKTA